MIYALHQYYPTRNQVFILVYYQPHYGQDVRSVVAEQGFQIDFQYEDRISVFTTTDSEKNAVALKNILADAINTRIQYLDSQPCLSFFVQRLDVMISIFSRRWTRSGWTRWAIWKQFSSLSSAYQFLEDFREYGNCHFWYYAHLADDQANSEMDLLHCKTTYALVKETIK